MTEQTFAPPKLPALTGDAVSQLVQIVARNQGVKVQAYAKGDDAVLDLMKRVYNAEMERTELWTLVSDLLKLMDSTPNLPEAFTASMAAGVLRSRANRDLRRKS